MRIPWIPEGTQLGTLELRSVYLYYDAPVLFSARNRSGTLFIVVWADKTDRDEMWLFCPISQRRLKALEQQQLDVRSAFMDPEDGFVGLMRLGIRAKSTQFEFVSPSELDPDLLPVHGEVLPNVPTVEDERPSVRELAGSVRRLFARTALAFEGHQGFEAPLRPLGRLFSAIQDCVDAINQAKRGHATVRGAISSDDLQLSRLMAVGSFEGSFGIEIAAAADPNLFDDTPIADAFKEFERLLHVSGEPELLRASVQPLGIRAAVKYRLLLEHLLSAKAGISVEWSTPTGRAFGAVRLPSHSVAGALQVLTQFETDSVEPITVIGTLVAINTTTGYFDLRDLSSKQRYTGKVISSSLLESQTTVNQNYTAILYPYCEVDSTTGEEKFRYDLFDLKAVQ